MENGDRQSQNLLHFRIWKRRNLEWWVWWHSGRRVMSKNVTCHKKFNGNVYRGARAGYPKATQADDTIPEIWKIALHLQECGRTQGSQDKQTPNARTIIAWWHPSTPLFCLINWIGPILRQKAYIKAILGRNFESFCFPSHSRITTIIQVDPNYYNRNEVRAV